MSSKRHATKKQADLIAAGIMLLIGIYVSIEVAGFKKIASLDIGPAFFPKILGWLLIAFSIMLGVEAIKKNDTEEVVFLNRNLLIVFAFVGVYAIVFNWAGFILTSAVLLSILMKLMGAETWKKTIIISIITTFIIYGIFHTFLNVPLPLGLLEGLI